MLQMPLLKLSGEQVLSVCELHHYCPLCLGPLSAVQLLAIAVVTI